MSIRAGSGVRVAVCVAAISLVAGIAVAVPSDACVPVEDRLLGAACLQPDGLFRLDLPDGWSFLTHGADFLADETANEAIFFSRLGTKPPSCIGNPDVDHRVEVLYARPSDVPVSRFATMVTPIRTMIGKVNAMLDMEGRSFGIPSMRYRMLCAGTKVRVTRVDLSQRRSSLDIATLITDVRSAGHTDPLAKYWIYVDVSFGGALGLADFRSDDSASPRNVNNYGPNYAMFFGSTGGLGAEVLMHEASHSMGAIATAAPNGNWWASGGFRQHCTDDQDVMCYGVAAGARYRWWVCSRVYFDCRHDDYFNPRARSGSFLAKHWNLGSPYNRFMSGCQFRSGRITAGRGEAVDQNAAAVPGWKPLSTALASVVKGCWGHPFAAYGSVAPVMRTLREEGLPFQEDYLHPSTLSTIDENVDVDVCFYKKATLLRCYASGTWEKGSVPSGATLARVVLASGADVNWVLSVF
jgi:hypothetical protein